MACNFTTLMSPGRSTEEIEKAARKKGRAYLCLRCLHKSGREYIDVKYRMEAHVIRDHLRRDEVPYYCSLCQFRCTRREELDEHVRRYKKHTVIAQQAGVDPLDPSCLKSNGEAYKIGARDYVVFEKDESFNHWKTCLLRRQTTAEPGPDCLSQALAEVFPEGLASGLTEPLFEEPTVSLAPVSMAPVNMAPTMSNQVTCKPPNTPTTLVSLSREDLRAAVTPILQQLSAIVDPTTLSDMLRDDAEPMPSRTVEASTIEKPVIATSYTEPAGGERGDSIINPDNPTPVGDESILSELLPQEDQGFTPKRKRECSVIPNKRMRSRSPSSSSSRSSTPSQDAAELSLASLQEAVGKGMEKVETSLAGNTSAIQSLEKSILTLAEAVTVLTKTMKSQDTRKEGERKEKEVKEKDKKGTEDREYKGKENKRGSGKGEGNSTSGSKERGRGRTPDRRERYGGQRNDTRKVYSIYDRLDRH